MNIKKQLYTESLNFVKKRYTETQKLINEIQNALLSETKSSAGDKHETGRAMLQIEREKVGNQFIEIERLQQILQRIDLKKNTTKTCLGSLVITTNGTYFIAIGRGVVTVNNQNYFVIGVHSPIGTLLLGKQKGDVFTFNNKKIEILELQ